MQFPDFSFLPQLWVASYGLSILTAILVLLAGWLVSRLVSRLATGALPIPLRLDPTVVPLVKQLIRYGVLILALVIALGQVGIETTSLLAVLGAAGLAIALALQGTLANIAAGVMLIWLRPIAAGEQIDAQGVGGTVVEIGLFGTQLRTPEGLYVFAPNSKIWGAAITNYSREPRRRIELRITVPPDSDLVRLRGELAWLANNDDRILKEPAPILSLDSVGGGSMTVVAQLWTATAGHMELRYNLVEEIRLRLTNAGMAPSAIT